MTRKSKRELEREVKTLDAAADAGDAPDVYVFVRENHFDRREDAERPDLTISDPDRGGYKTTTPSYVRAEQYAGRILFVTPSVVDTWPGSTGDDALPIPDLWDNLTDEQLRAERRRREANDDPIPPILNHHAR